MHTFHTLLCHVIRLEMSFSSSSAQELKVCVTSCRRRPPVVAQALVGGDAEADKELCVRAMGAIYSAHAGAVGVLSALCRVRTFDFAGITPQEYVTCSCC